jgi:peptide/nickel transport system permease protein
MRLRDVLRRLAVAPFVIWGVATLVFIAVRVVPGSAVDALSGVSGTPEQKQELRDSLGLGHSLLHQYGVYLWDAVRGDFGISYYSSQAVSTTLGETLPVTIELAVAAGLIMVGWGVFSGALAARFRDRPLDLALRVTAATLFSIPWFFAGVGLLLLFTSIIPILPGYGRLPPTAVYEPSTHFVLLDALVQGRSDLVGPWLERLILPAVAVGLTTAGYIARVTRASCLEVLTADHVRTARSKGMTEARVFRHHVLRNAGLPIVTIAGLQVGALLGGAIVSEVVFSYPGVGKLLVDSISRRDYPVIQGASLVVATLYVLVNMVTEITYAIVDPRLRR